MLQMCIWAKGAREVILKMCFSLKKKKKVSLKCRPPSPVPPPFFFSWKSKLWLFIAYKNPQVFLTEYFYIDR